MNERLLINAAEIAPGYTFHDLLTDGIAEQIEVAPVYEKQGTYKIRIVEKEEEWFDTYVKGKFESRKRAVKGDGVVTGALGEEYPIDAKTLTKRYRPDPENPGWYIATGKMRAIDNPYGHPIAFVSSWGEIMYGEDNCKIFSTVDSETHEVETPGKFQSIDFEAFNKTYKPLES